ncbi:phosphatidylserine/phosphatidylglycerophosphate/cardiolipin synthase family protein [Patescibacteria group bacterium]|nr:MAG: phosphatidylserine/phosphatidylglycerophosphate/cardiolipin synthase family protein [Patescibacteria group bacterium]
MAQLDPAIIPSGHEAYTRMLSDITAAKREVVYANFCFLPGKSFNRLADALTTAAKRGVEVYIVADWYGSSALGEKRVAKLRAAGVQWTWFRPKRWRTIASYNRRMHKKLLIVDRRVAYTGGVGWADFWERPTVEYPAAWRDTHFRITDSGTITAMYNSAIDSWNKFSGHKLTPLKTALTGAKILNSVPPRLHRLSPAGRQFADSLDLARTAVKITTAYFGPSRSLRQALIRTAKRGVKVELLLNGPHASHEIAAQAGRAYYDQLLKAGVQIYEYQPTKLHAKLMTIDGRQAIIGSANWNFRSLHHDQECNLTVASADFCRQLDRQFEADKRQSARITEVDPSQIWKQRLSSLGRYFF